MSNSIVSDIKSILGRVLITKLGKPQFNQARKEEKKGDKEKQKCQK